MSPTTLDGLVVEAAIRALVARYARDADALDGPAMTALFAEDGALVVAGNRYAGHEAISGWMAKVAGAATMRGRHIVSNLVIDWSVSTPDIARATADMIFVARPTGDAPLSIIAAARYEDCFAHTVEGWRFAERQILFG